MLWAEYDGGAIVTGICLVQFPLMENLIFIIII